MAALEERIRTLRKRFTATLPERVEALHRAVKRMSADPSAAEIREDLEGQFHTLGGTAGTFGLNDVTALAYEGEATCGHMSTQASLDEILYLDSIVVHIADVAGIHARASYS